MTHRRRSWLLLLAPALLATALPLRAEPIPIPTSSPFPIEGLMTRMLNQADVPPIARPLLDTLRRGLERGSLTADEVTAMQRGLLGLIESLPAAMGGRP